MRVSAPGSGASPPRRSRASSRPPVPSGGAARYLSHIRPWCSSARSALRSTASRCTPQSFFPRIRRLVLRDNDGLGPSAGESLARGSSLVTLSLSRAYVGDEGIEAIARSAEMRNLEELDLVGNDLTVRGVEALVISPHLAKLRRVSGLVGGYRSLVEETAVARMLRERFGDGAA
jgi:hypothetical protein